MTIFNMLKGSTFLRAPDGGASDGGAGAPWYQGMVGVDDAVIGSITAKGWDKLPVNQAAVQAIAAWRSAETLVGTPAENLLKLPKDPAAPEWSSVWSRLGRPDAADKYDVSAIKRASGAELDPSFVSQMQNLAHKLNLPADRATDLVTEVVKLQDTVTSTAEAERSAKLIEERAALTQNWGANMEANKIVAQNAARALGVEPEQIAALEGVIGYAKVMEMFRNIGTKIGEDRYINSGAQGGNGGVMSRDQASSRRAELMKDSGWTSRYLAGGTEEAKEMQSLNKILSAQ